MVNQASLQKENSILKNELQMKYREIVELKKIINQMKAKEFLEKRLVLEN
jgi:hypothetical protein